MSRLFDTPPSTNTKALLRSAKKQLDTWKKTEIKSLPIKEMEVLGFELVDTFLQIREPKLLQMALSLFELIHGTTLMTFPGYVAYVEACLLMNNLFPVSSLMEEMERFRPGSNQYKEARTNNWTKSKIINMLNVRRDLRIAMLHEDFETAIFYFDKLSEAERDRDPYLRMLASIAHIRLAAINNANWEFHAQMAITLADEYAERFGENFEVFLQRAMANEKFEKWGATYENFEKAYQHIDQLDNKKAQRIQRTLLSLTLWHLTQRPEVFKKIRKQCIKPEMPLLDRVELLRRPSKSGDWDAMLRLSCNLAPTDLTANEANLISFAAIEKDDYNRAEAVLEASGRNNDGNVQRLLHLSRLYYVQGMLELAIDYAELATRFCIAAQVSESMASHIIQMTVHIMHEQSIRAKNFDRLIELINEFPETWKNNDLKILHVQMMMSADTVNHKRVYVKRALKVLKSIKAKERIVDWYVLSGRLKMLQEKFADAIKDFNKAKKLLDKSHEGADTILMIIENSIEDCERALHENATGEGEGALGHERLMYKTLIDHGIKVHRIAQLEPGSMPIAIIERHDNKTKTAHLMTMALTYRQAKFEDAKPAEIGMAIPKSDIATLEPNDWRIRLLTALSISLQASQGIRPRNGMSLRHPTGEGIIPGAVYPSVVLYESWDKVIPDGAPIALVEVVPIYAEENDFASLMGSERLLLRLMEIPFYPVRPQRQNSCEGQNWKTLIPRHQIKPLYDDNGMIGCVNKSILIDGADSAIFYRVSKIDQADNDSGWFFLTGTEKEDDIGQDDRFVMIDLNTICNYIPYVIPYLGAPEGVAFVRDVSGIISSTSVEDSARLLKRINKKPLLA